MKLCFATHNRNKVTEIAHKLGNSFELVTLDDLGIGEIEETGNTLEENSRLKAEYVFLEKDISVFADDSGLEVEVLDGAPGVYSARYAGLPKSDGKNLLLLLKNLQNESNRKAQFKTVITLITGKETIQFTGIIKGRIAQEPAGSGGFGYDPVFIPDGHSRTFAQMTLEEKNSMSHRALATQKLLFYLKRQYHD